SLCPLWLISFKILTLGLYSTIWRKHMRRSILITVLVLMATIAVRAQVKPVSEYIDQVQALANRADLKTANDYIDRNHESVLREWIAITEINAPSVQEQPRGKYSEGLLREYHLDDIHSDSADKQIARRKATGRGPLL